MKKILVVVSILFAVGLTSVPQSASAQCPMCKLSAESDLKNGGRNGATLNTGIIYLLVMPYLLVGTIGFMWWRNRKLAEKSEQAEAIKELLEDSGVKMS